MMPFALTLGLLVAGLLLLLVYAPIGLPVIVIALIALVVALVRSRGGGEPIGTRERTRRREPTGEVRPSPGGPETANQRQGQV